jgi:hypothetical protein
MLLPNFGMFHGHITIDVSPYHQVYSDDVFTPNTQDKHALAYFVGIMRTYYNVLSHPTSHQHVRLGQRLHNKYITHEQLLDEHSPDLALRVRAYTTNQDRTLMSAQRYVSQSSFCLMVRKWIDLRCKLENLHI